MAAQLDATGISVEPRNKRGKTAKKVKDVKKIAISFTNVTVYWDVEEYLPAGTYHVYIFADGTMIGQQAFSMK